MAIAVERSLSGQAKLRDVKRMDGTESHWPEGSFQRVFLENYKRVTAVLYRIVGDRSQAEDLAIEVFWRLYWRPQVSEEQGNLSGWLYRTATHLGIDRLRAEARRARYEQEAGSLLKTHSRPDPLEAVLQDESRSRVREALAALRPARAQLLVLRATGFSYQELSATLGVKPGSIGTMLIRAEAEFRKYYLKLKGR